jgi:multisubunit Na+/H+ antiporter MnhC subunit
VECPIDDQTNEMEKFSGAKIAQSLIQNRSKVKKVVGGGWLAAGWAALLIMMGSKTSSTHPVINVRG